MEITSISNDPVVTSPSGTSPEPAVRAQNREVVQAVKALNAAELFGQENELTFVFDRHTHRAVVRIVNRDTREVVRQIPAEYALRMAEDLRSRQ